VCAGTFAIRFPTSTSPSFVGTWDRSGSQLHLALGTGLRPRVEQALPTVSEAEQRKLSNRRDLYKVKGQDKYLFRALDSTGQTIEFLLTAKRDKHAAKRFLVKAVEASGNPMPRVIKRRQEPGLSGCGRSAESRRSHSTTCPFTSVQVPQQCN
jgi:hypothetical protein